jgi:hypothetical protein
METSKPGESVYLSVGIWYNEKDGEIHMARRVIPKDGSRFHTRVGASSTNVRGHPSLFKALAKCLKEAGAPAPEVSHAPRP